ncbi:MAG: hypothetical protein IJQ31_00930 [Thermoguttaceae bacterium]|nr:hypothetical protein [Thermoguttaceae bacterium]
MVKTLRFSISFFLELSFLLCVVLMFCGSVFAEGMTVEEFNARLEAMEKENQELRAQLAQPDSDSMAPSSVSEFPPIPNEEPITGAVTENGTENETQSVLSPAPNLAISEKEIDQSRAKSVIQNAELEDYGSGMSPWNIREDDIEKELARYKGWAWDKNNFTLTPYVWVWVTGTYETNRMFAGDFPLWVRNGEKDKAAYIDAKPTRLGFNLACPEMACMPGTKITAVFETDFENTYTSENKPDMELRKAYIQLQNECSMFLFGQTWELISPLYPPTLNWGYGSSAGNFAFRRAQIRYDRYFKRENGRFAIQTCLIASQTANFTDAAIGTTYTGRFGSYPEFQLRFERTFKQTDLWKEAMFAVGGKIGEKEYVSADDEFHKTSWAFTADSKIRFNDRFYWMGELFVGEAMAINCAGVMQDLNPQTREKVFSSGGWMAFGWDLTPELHYSIGYAIDDPENSRLSEGMKSLNHFGFTNISRDITKQFNAGFEYEYCETEYYQVRKAHAHLFMINLLYKL